MGAEAKRPGKPILWIGVAAVLICLPVAALLVWDTNLESWAEQVMGSGTAEPRETRPASTAAGGRDGGDGDGEDDAPRIVTDLLEDPAYIEKESEQHGRYVSLEGPAGLWAVSDPAYLAHVGTGAIRPGEGMPFGSGKVTLAVHESLVRYRCLHVDIETRAPFRLEWKAAGSRGSAQVPVGRSLVEVACLRNGLARESVLVELEPAEELPASARPLVKGIRIASSEQQPLTGDGHEHEPCGRFGILVEPGTTYFFRAMGEKGDMLDLEAGGDGVGSLGVSVRTTPGGKRLLVEPGEAAQAGTLDPEPLEMGLERQIPVEVAVSLTSDAGGDVCLESLGIVRPRPAEPFLSEPLPEVEGVVFVLLDTLRGDAPGALNDRSPVLTPVIGSLAEQSVVFDNATSSANYTKPSMGTILTGLWPHSHGALPHKAVLSPETTLVTQMLSDEGVETVGVFSNRFLTDKFGFMRGWDEDVHVNAYKACLDGEIVIDAARETLDGWEPRGPFFLYVHFMDPHAPYEPDTSLEVKYVGHRVVGERFTPRSTSVFIREIRRGDVEMPSKAELKIIRGLYRADVAHTDDLLGRLIETLDEEGILDRALLIVTSDHGEEFMEHGWLGHGTNIHHELTHVPLLVRWPGGGITGTYEGLVGHTDMTPTILEAFGIDVPAALPGTSLQSRLTHPEVPGQPPVYLLEHWNGTYGLRVDRWMIVTSRTTTSLARTRGHRIWYQDPGRNPVTWLYLRQRLAQELLAEFKSGPSISGDAEIDDETREQLEAMGYILSGDDGVAGD